MWSIFSFSYSFCSGIFYYASAHLPICKEKHPKIYKDKMGSYVARDEYEKGSEIRFFDFVVIVLVCIVWKICLFPFI